MNNYTNRLTQQTSVEEGMKQARARTEVEAQVSSDTHPKQIKETSNTQTFDYFLFKADGKYIQITDEGGTIDEAWELYYQDEEAEVEGVVLNKSHYFTGYWFFNDEYCYDDVDNYDVISFNTKEHLELYSEMDYGGHYQLVKIEEWKDGEMINTTLVSTKDGYIL